MLPLLNVHFPNLGQLSGLMLEVLSLRKSSEKGCPCRKRSKGFVKGGVETLPKTTSQWKWVTLPASAAVGKARAKSANNIARLILTTSCKDDFGPRQLLPILKVALRPSPSNLETNLPSPDNPVDAAHGQDVGNAETFLAKGVQLLSSGSFIGFPKLDIYRRSVHSVAQIENAPAVALEEEEPGQSSLGEVQ